MRRAEAAQLQVAAYWALKALRSHMEPCEILERLRAAGVSLTPVDLSRYLGGFVLPSPSRAEALLKAIVQTNLLGEVLARVARVDERGVVNTIQLAFDRDLLVLAAVTAYAIFRGKKITKVLTAAVNGVPLASLTAFLLRAGLCVAKREADAFPSRYAEVKYFAPDPPRYVSLYLPVSALRKGDRVLIVDDLLQSGRTLKALLELAGKAGARPVAVFSMLAVGSGWKRVVNGLGAETYIGYEIKWPI